MDGTLTTRTVPLFHFVTGSLTHSLDLGQFVGELRKWESLQVDQELGV